ncbi:hypothetical protein [Paenibacillus gallinarum]|uniref:DUF3953 domain-containing protein n=1 Tax=Paenibacillus gallinarum TaxID=2762232 RepID=A0ABR8T0G9_9BACL|nr:hypothetical protein [Paenibacillus gallinarum]MBD7969257.1 hypothetical protein [Paenibacillus gallinarum]
MRKDKRVIYLNVALGTIGIILVGLGAFRYQLLNEDIEGQVISYLGFILTIVYINYLEQKAGISKKVTWIKSIISIIVFVISAYYLFSDSFA